MTAPMPAPAPVAAPAAAAPAAGAQPAFGQPTAAAGAPPGSTVTEENGEQSATDAAGNDLAAWQAAAEADTRYQVVSRPINGVIG